MRGVHEEYAQGAYDLSMKTLLKFIGKSTHFFCCFLKGGLRMPAPNRNDKEEFWTVSMAMKELNMCRASTVKLAAEAGALLRYGNSQRINWNRLNSYFQENCIEKVL